jgi:hypothetical protein
MKEILETPNLSVLTYHLACQSIPSCPLLPMMSPKLLPIHISKVACQQYYSPCWISNAAVFHRFKEKELLWLLLLATRTISNQPIQVHPKHSKLTRTWSHRSHFHPCKHGQLTGYFSIPRIQHLCSMEYCTNVGTILVCCTSANITRGRCMMMPWCVRLLVLWVLTVFA